jgi:hypothetical protein
MKHRRLLVKAATFGFLAALGSVTPLHAQDQNNQGSSGASYLTTVYSSGNFASRGVITLHDDHTMSVIDSGQGGPTFFFTSQLGSWKWKSGGGIEARTIDFDFPTMSTPGDVARLDYTISFAQGGSEVTGTITLTVFPLTGNPLGGGGTAAGTFTFTGQLIRP